MPNRNQWYGCLPDVPDHRDRPLRAEPPGALPSTVDLRRWLPPVMNQGPLGSCTAHGVTTAARYHVIRRGTTPDFEMSRLQLYYDSRASEGTVQSDAGAQIRDVVKTLVARGVGHEELWPYEPANFAAAPPDEVYADAVQYKALSYERVDVSATALTAALAAGSPVVIGISVYDSFESDEVARTGLVPMPALDEGLVGGHCMLVVGRGQRPGTFTVRNSWGADWGDGGDCYIPEAYLGSTTYGSDYWVINTFGSEAEKEAGIA